MDRIIDEVVDRLAYLSPSENDQIRTFHQVYDFEIQLATVSVPLEHADEQPEAVDEQPRAIDEKLDALLSSYAKRQRTESIVIK